MITYRRKLDREEIKPVSCVGGAGRDRKRGRHLSRTGPSSQVMALGLVPMCSYQMERMFNTTPHPRGRTQVWGRTRAPVLGPGGGPSLPAMGPPRQCPAACCSLSILSMLGS